MQNIVEFMDQFVFIDAETTGLNHRDYSILEVTYAVGLNKPVTIYPDSDAVMDALGDADPKALEVNKYVERFTSDSDEGRWVFVPEQFSNKAHYEESGYHRAWLNLPDSPEDAWNDFANVLKGRTWVGANPRFDVNFIEEFYYPEILNYSHRLFDIQAWVAGFNGQANIPSMSGLAAQYATTQPDHTSLNDVIALREVFIETVVRAKRYNSVKIAHDLAKEFMNRP